MERTGERTYERALPRRFLPPRPAPPPPLSSSATKSLTDADHFSMIRTAQRRFAPTVIGITRNSDRHQIGMSDRHRRNTHHLEEKSILVVIHGPLQAVNSSQLIRSQKPQLVGLNITRAFGPALPTHLGRVAGTLRQHDVILADRITDEALGVGDHLLIAHHRIRRGE